MGYIVETERPDGPAAAERLNLEPDHAGQPPQARQPRAPSLWIRLFPIVFFLAYLTATVLLFAFGPWPYPVEDGTKLYAFICAAHLALLFGYLSALRSPGRTYSGRWSPRKLLTSSLFVSLPILFATFVFRVGVSPGDLFGGQATLGDAYRLSNSIRSDDTPLIEYARVLVGPWLVLVFPLAVFYWKSLSRTARILAVACITGNIAMFVLMGTNKLIADTTILFPWLVLASYLAGLNRFRLTKAIVASAITLALLAGFVFFFAETMVTRLGGFSSVDEAYSPAGNVWADNDNFIVRKLSGETKRAVLSGISYLTHGYFAVYLALDKPFVPTFGVGNSFFLVRQTARLTGSPDLEQDPYPMRIEENGWDAYGYWSTIYPWIASDVSFPGTLIVVFLIGRLFALSWLDTLRGRIRLPSLCSRSSS